MYTINKIITVKPYRCDVCAVKAISMHKNKHFLARNQFSSHEIFNQPRINDHLSINCNTFEIVFIKLKKL